ncbi:MAG: hypothetical protein WDN49_21345 [Acetobacteraceae bacterium]
MPATVTWLARETIFRCSSTSTTVMISISTPSAEASFTLGGENPIKSQICTEMKCSPPGSPSTAGIANSSTSSTNTSSPAESRAGAISGRVIWTRTCSRPAPLIAAASSSVASMLRRAADTNR